MFILMNTLVFPASANDTKMRKIVNRFTPKNTKRAHTIINENWNLLQGYKLLTNARADMDKTERNLVEAAKLVSKGNDETPLLGVVKNQANLGAATHTQIVETAKEIVEKIPEEEIKVLKSASIYSEGLGSLTLVPGALLAFGYALVNFLKYSVAVVNAAPEAKNLWDNTWKSVIIGAVLIGAWSLRELYFSSKTAKYKSTAKLAGDAQGVVDDDKHAQMCK